MAFLIRSGLWLALVGAFLPQDPFAETKAGFGSDAVSVEAAGLALCDQNRERCETARRSAELAREYGAAAAGVALALAGSEDG
ncbi:MAG: hypothetical protein ACFB2Z_02810 [Maricaulaceae bacterium]